MKEDICKQYIWLGVNIQNVQKAHATEQRGNKVNLI